MGMLPSVEVREEGVGIDTSREKVKVVLVNPKGKSSKKKKKNGGRKAEEVKGK